MVHWMKVSRLASALFRASSIAIVFCASSLLSKRWIRLVEAIFFDQFREHLGPEGRRGSECRTAVPEHLADGQAFRFVTSHSGFTMRTPAPVPPQAGQCPPISRRRFRLLHITPMGPYRSITTGGSPSCGGREVRPRPAHQAPALGTSPASGVRPPLIAHPIQPFLFFLRAFTGASAACAGILSELLHQYLLDLPPSSPHVVMHCHAMSRCSSAIS